MTRVPRDSLSPDAIKLVVKVLTRAVSDLNIAWEAAQIKRGAEAKQYKSPEARLQILESAMEHAVEDLNGIRRACCKESKS